MSQYNVLLGMHIQKEPDGVERTYIWNVNPTFESDDARYGRLDIRHPEKYRIVTDLSLQDRGRLQSLEEENRKLKEKIAELELV